MNEKLTKDNINVQGLFSESNDKLEKVATDYKELKSRFDKEALLRKDCEDDLHTIATAYNQHADNYNKLFKGIKDYIDYAGQVGESHFKDFKDRIMQVSDILNGLPSKVNHIGYVDEN
jgi:hypothetical protein